MNQTEIIPLSLDRGHQVTAYVRRPEALSIQHPGLRVITGTLDNTDQLREAITGADACFRHWVAIRSVNDLPN